MGRERQHAREGSALEEALPAGNHVAEELDHYSMWNSDVGQRGLWGGWGRDERGGGREGEMDWEPSPIMMQQLADSRGNSVLPPRVPLIDGSGFSPSSTGEKPVEMGDGRLLDEPTEPNIVPQMRARAMTDRQGAVKRDDERGGENVCTREQDFGSDRDKSIEMDQSLLKTQGAESELEPKEIINVEESACTVSARHREGGECGTAVREVKKDLKRCENCHSQQQDFSAKFCLRCGTPYSERGAERSEDDDTEGERAWGRAWERERARKEEDKDCAGDEGKQKGRARMVRKELSESALTHVNDLNQDRQCDATVESRLSKGGAAEGDRPKSVEQVQWQGRQTLRSSFDGEVRSVAGSEAQADGEMVQAVAEAGGSSGGVSTGNASIPPMRFSLDNMVRRLSSDFRRPHPLDWMRAPGLNQNGKSKSNPSSSCPGPRDGKASDAVSNDQNHIESRSSGGIPIETDRVGVALTDNSTVDASSDDDTSSYLSSADEVSNHPHQPRPRKWSDDDASPRRLSLSGGSESLSVSEDDSLSSPLASKAATGARAQQHAKREPPLAASRDRKRRADGRNDRMRSRHAEGRRKSGTRLSADLVLARDADDETGRQVQSRYQRKKSQKRHGRRHDRSSVATRPGTNPLVALPSERAASLAAASEEEGGAGAEVAKEGKRSWFAGVGGQGGLRGVGVGWSLIRPSRGFGGSAKSSLLRGRDTAASSAAELPEVTKEEKGGMETGNGGLGGSSEVKSWFRKVVTRSPFKGNDGGVAREAQEVQEVERLASLGSQGVEGIGERGGEGEAEAAQEIEVAERAKLAAIQKNLHLHLQWLGLQDDEDVERREARFEDEGQGRKGQQEWDRSEEAKMRLERGGMVTRDLGDRKTADTAKASIGEHGNGGRKGEKERKTEHAKDEEIPVMRTRERPPSCSKLINESTAMKVKARVERERAREKKLREADMRSRETERREKKEEESERERRAIEGEQAHAGRIALEGEEQKQETESERSRLQKPHDEHAQEHENIRAWIHEQDRDASSQGTMDSTDATVAPSAAAAPKRGLSAAEARLAVKLSSREKERERMTAELASRGNGKEKAAEAAINATAAISKKLSAGEIQSVSSMHDEKEREGLRESEMEIEREGEAGRKREMEKARPREKDGEKDREGERQRKGERERRERENGRENEKEKESGRDTERTSTAKRTENQRTAAAADATRSASVGFTTDATIDVTAVTAEASEAATLGRAKRVPRSAKVS